MYMYSNMFIFCQQATISWVGVYYILYLLKSCYFLLLSKIAVIQTIFTVLSIVEANFTDIVTISIHPITATTVLFQILPLLLPPMSSSSSSSSLGNSYITGLFSEIRNKRLIAALNRFFMNKQHIQFDNHFKFYDYVSKSSYLLAICKDWFLQLLFVVQHILVVCRSQQTQEAKHVIWKWYCNQNSYEKRKETEKQGEEQKKEKG